jgi:hypothetical protein
MAAQAVNISHLFEHADEPTQQAPQQQQQQHARPSRDADRMPEYPPGASAPAPAPTRRVTIDAQGDRQMPPVYYQQAASSSSGEYDDEDYVLPSGGNPYTSILGSSLTSGITAQTLLVLAILIILGTLSAFVLGRYMSPGRAY